MSKPKKTLYQIERAKLERAMRGQPPGSQITISPTPQEDREKRWRIAPPTSTRRPS